MTTTPTKFKLGHLGNLNQVIIALGRTLRAMADDSIDVNKGSKICHGLGILRACIETQKLEALDARMDEIADRTIARLGARSEQHEIYRPH